MQSSNASKYFKNLFFGSFICSNKNSFAWNVQKTNFERYFGDDCLQRIEYLPINRSVEEVTGNTFCKFTKK